MKLNSSLIAYYSTLWVGTVITILPIWNIKYPPLVDYPNHLARAYIISNYNNVDIFQKYFLFRKEPIPNITFDVLVSIFNYITGDIYISGKLFITLSVVLIIYGCHQLVINLRGFSCLGLLGLYFSYNSGLLYGFMNYVFGLGICLISIAIWVKYKYTLNVRVSIVLILMSFLSYVSHLSSFVFLNMVIFTISVYDYLFNKDNNKDVFAYLSGFILTSLPVLLMISFMHGSGTIGPIVWNSFKGKIINILGSVSLYNYKIDIIGGIFIVIICISLIYLLIKGIISYNVNTSVFVAGLILWISFLVCPKVMFTSYAADARFIPIAAIMTIVSVKININKYKKFLNVFFALCIVFVLGFRLWQIKHYWGSISNDIEAQIQYFDFLEKGSIITPIIILPQEYQDNKIVRPLYHVIQYATIEKQTISTSLFALRGQNILNFKPEFNIPAYQLNENTKFDKLDLNNIFHITKYYWTYAVTDNIENHLLKKCKLLLNQDKVKIYKMVE